MKKDPDIKSAPCFVSMKGKDLRRIRFEVIITYTSPYPHKLVEAV